MAVSAESLETDFDLGSAAVVSIAVIALLYVLYKFGGSISNFFKGAADTAVQTVSTAGAATVNNGGPPIQPKGVPNTTGNAPVVSPTGGQIGQGKLPDCLFPPTPVPTATPTKICNDFSGQLTTGSPESCCGYNPVSDQVFSGGGGVSPFMPTFGKCSCEVQ